MSREPLLGKIEVQQVSDDAELWALCIHDGVQWVQLGPPDDVCLMHEAAERLRKIMVAYREAQP